MTSAPEAEIAVVPTTDNNKDEESSSSPPIITEEERLKALKEEAERTSLSLASITDGQNIRNIPKTRFIEDIDEFANTFTPPASAELLIGAYSDLFGKFKHFETSLSRKIGRFQEKIPEIEKSLQLVKYLKQKMEDDEIVITRYNLADTIFTKAQVDCSTGTVNLWLGANVMLEYTYDEAIDLLQTKLDNAQRDLKEVTEDLSFTRNQVITSEVCISRIYNWDVRTKRAKRELLEG